jgi:hypothetical protein
MNLTAGCLRRGNGAIWLSGPGRLHTDTRLLQGFLHWIANQLPWKQQEVKSLVVGTNDGAEACHLVGTKTLKLDGVPSDRTVPCFFLGSLAALAHLPHAAEIIRNLRNIQ